MIEIILTAIEKEWWGLPFLSGIDPYPENTIISSMGLWSLGLAVCVVVLGIIISYCVDRNYRWFENLANRFLTHAFISVWIFGFIVYEIGMYTGAPESLFGNIPMSILHAFEMFLIESDVSAIHSAFHDNACYMFAFSMAHFLAALVSLVFVLKHFGFNLIAAFRRWFFIYSKESTFIFWGMNDASYYLAKDIKRNLSKMGNSRIVVVRTNHDDETGIVKNGMERLFNFLSLRNKDLDRLKELECITTTSYSNLANIDIQQPEKTRTLDILQNRLRLRSLCRIINKKTTGSVHLFFLSEDEAANIQAIANLKNDSTLLKFTQKGRVYLYCHARYNSIHRIIEDEPVSRNMEVRIVDSSHISVELMKKNSQLHPVNFVKVENDATVSTPFNAMVIGFGEVGLETVRFLYEFGAFVKSNEKEIRRSAFKCQVVDKNMEALSGVFVMNAPAIRTKVMKEDDCEEEIINLYKMDCRSEEFYRKIKRWIPELNYIVMATDDDETNISMAVRIFRLAVRERCDTLTSDEHRKECMRHFKILVRVQHDENGHIRKIAEHYNRLWAAEQNGKTNDYLHQDVITPSDKVSDIIFPFGSAEQVYTYDYVVNDSLRNDAKNFKAKYDLSVNEIRQSAGLTPYDIEEWDEEQDKLMQLTGRFEGYMPTYSGIMKLRRVQNQNIANSLHKETKKILAEQALGKDLLEVMNTHGLQREVGTPVYSWSDDTTISLNKIQKVLDTLAQTEHLRWNASHEILGYRNEGDEKYKDEARLRHGCLKNWEELSVQMRSNDYDVVDVSLLH